MRLSAGAVALPALQVDRERGCADRRREPPFTTTTPAASPTRGQPAVRRGFPATQIRSATASGTSWLIPARARSVRSARRRGRRLAPPPASGADPGYVRQHRAGARGPTLDLLHLGPREAHRRLPARDARGAGALRMRPVDHRRELKQRARRARPRAHRYPPPAALAHPPRPRRRGGRPRARASRAYRPRLRRSARRTSSTRPGSRRARAASTATSSTSSGASSPPSRGEHPRGRRRGARASSASPRRATRGTTSATSTPTGRSTPATRRASASSRASSSFPPAPPPEFDRDAWLETLDEIERRAPQRLALVHFGVADDPGAHLAELRERIERWSAEIEAGAEQDAFIEEREAEVAPLPPGAARLVRAGDPVLALVPRRCAAGPRSAGNARREPARRSPRAPVPPPLHRPHRSLLGSAFATGRARVRRPRHLNGSATDLGFVLAAIWIPRDLLHPRRRRLGRPRCRATSSWSASNLVMFAARRPSPRCCSRACGALAAHRPPASSAAWRTRSSSRPRPA